MMGLTFHKHFLPAAFIAAIFALVSAGGAQAQEPKLQSQEKDWGVYVVDQGGVKTCFALSQPKDQAPKNVNRDPTYFFVTFGSEQKVRNQISVIIGYPFKEDSRVIVEIGADKFTLFTGNNKAWIEDEAEQDKLVAAMKGGASMIVRGISHRNTRTTDKYSLAGVTAALTSTVAACN